MHLQSSSFAGGLGRSLVSMLLGLVCGVCSETALAQVSASEKAAAEALFDKGRKLMLQGEFEPACRALERSQAIEEAIGTMLYLAECYEKTQRYASAWAMFREAASRAEAEGQVERAAQGTERARRLEPLLSKLTVSVASENSMQGFAVALDDKPLAAALFEVEFPIDPGEHRISASAPNHQSWTGSVSITGAGASARIDVPQLAPDAPVEAPVVTPAPAVAPSPNPAPAADPAMDSPLTDTGADSGSGQRTVALILGGVGVVGLGTGTYFGLEASSTDDEAEDICPRSEPCDDQRGLDLTSEAQDQALIANIAFGVGGAALIAGAILYFTVDSDQTETTSLRAEPVIGPGYSGASLRGVF